MEILKAKSILSNDPIFKEILNIDIKIPEYEGHVDAYLYSSIVSQQLSVKSAEAIYNRFVAYFGTERPEPSRLIATPEEDMRALGLSKSKATYIKNVASYFKVNPSTPEFWNDKKDEEIVDELTTINGVGVWTVQMVLIFSLARRDVFPILDLGVRNSAIELYDLHGDKKEINARLIKIAEGWKPYRSIASLYLWAWRNQRLK